MKKHLFPFLFVATVVMAIFSGCTSTNVSMREPSAHMQWHKADFSYSGQVSAEASTTRILMIDWARLFKKETGTVTGTAAGLIDLANIPVIGSVLSDRTANYALYKLMQDNPGYDVVFYPQYEVKNSYPGPFRIFFQKTDVKVTARLAKID
ncbi:MAG TPA: hypothetical protein VHS96_13805 [Bacteroidia bacterium]|nr:hypothetical protein [Bacteroidia bacterium]